MLAKVSAPGELQVGIEWQGRRLGVPLAQLRGEVVAKDSAEALADWRYWAAQGRWF